MPPFAVAHQRDEEADQDVSEIVGSKDLRETFKDPNHRARGSLYINGVMLRQFEANSPASVVSRINGYSSQTGVTAEIDDGGHLVLVNSSPAPITIGLGPAFDEPPPVSGTQSTAEEVVQRLKAEGEAQRRKDDGRPANTILEDLGLEETSKLEAASGDAEGGGERTEEPARPGFEVGASAEERHKRRQEAREKAKQEGGPRSEPLTSGQTRNPTQIPSAPIAQTDSGGGKLADGRQRVGTGAGHQLQPDGTRPVPGTENQQPGPADPAVG